MILLPEYHFMSMPGSLGGWQDDMAKDAPLFKGAGGAAESDADGFSFTDSSAKNQGSGMKTVSRVRQEFPEAWIWTETHTKYFKITKTMAL